MSEEVWKDIPGYEGFYKISSSGIVKSVIHKDKYGRTFGGKTLKQTLNEAGYYRVHLSMFKIRRMEFVHRLVALTFIENVNNYQEVNHKDENPKNNSVENLEWCDHKYNINYGNRNRLSGIKHRGELCCFHKLTEKSVREIRAITNGNTNKKQAKELAEKYCVSVNTIKRIATHYTWSWIK